MLADLENEGRSLRKPIEAGSHGSDSRLIHDGTEGAPDWKKLSTQALRLNQTSVGYGKFRKRLEQLSSDEILAGLEKMMASTSRSDGMLKGLLIGALIKKDPLLALDRLAGKTEEGSGMSPTALARGMKELAMKDPATAVAWFDRGVADGTFKSKRLDGISRARLELEGALITGLISSDPAAATERLKAMPEGTRESKINDYANQPLDEGKQVAFVKMIRELLPESSQRVLISNQAAELAGQGGLAAVSEFLVRVDVTDVERARAVESAVSRRLWMQALQAAIVPGDIDSLRQWAATEAPGSEERVTGSALSNLGLQDFPTAAALALKYHEQSEGDELLRVFLAGVSMEEHGKEARAMAEKIRDESLRNRVLNHGQWNRQR